PFSIVLLNPSLDRWAPSEHNGTFRGNNHAFVTATAALEYYWGSNNFEHEINRKAELTAQHFKESVNNFNPPAIRVKGRGLMQGIECINGDVAEAVCRHAFERGLVIETAGNQGQVVKCFCPLTIGEEDLLKGLKIINMSFAAVMDKFV